MVMSVEDAQAALAQLEELRPPDMERSEWYARMLVAAAAVRDKTMRWFWDAAAGEWVPAIEVYRVVVDGRPAVDVVLFDDDSERRGWEWQVRPYAHAAPGDVPELAGFGG